MQTLCIVITKLIHIYCVYGITSQIASNCLALSDPTENPNKWFLKQENTGSANGSRHILNTALISCNKHENYTIQITLCFSSTTCIEVGSQCDIGASVAS